MPDETDATSAPAPERDPNSPHILNVGPHAHTQAIAGSDGTNQYLVCTICGARSGRGPGLGQYPQQAWINGGDWVGDGLLETPLLRGPMEGHSERVDWVATHEAQAEKALTVTKTDPFTGQPLELEERELRPGQLAEERGHPVKGFGPNEAEQAQAERVKQSSPGREQQPDEPAERGKKDSEAQRQNLQSSPRSKSK